MTKHGAPTRPRVVFCRVGWMKFYGLWQDDMGPIGGGSYNDEAEGWETDNFREFDGSHLGYFRSATGDTGLNLRRIDPTGSDLPEARRNDRGSRGRVRTETSAPAVG